MPHEWPHVPQLALEVERSTQPVLHIVPLAHPWTPWIVTVSEDIVVRSR